MQRQPAYRLVPAAVLVLAHNVYAQTLPYIPTRLLLSSNDSTALYIIQPISSASTQSQLLLLNLTSTIQASSLSPTLLSSSLPFTQDTSSGTAYVASISSSGYIDVYAGSCSSAGSVWTWQPSTSNNGTWSQSATSLTSSMGDANAGVNFLSSAFTYSTLVTATNAQSTHYVFGGMCPTTSTTNASTWQSKATYSNRMLKIASTSTAYTISQSTPSGNIPIVEAGSTMTALTPTYSNSSAGVVSQAQNFVLIGGHTQTAFTNMSQIAIYSLPQENWSYQTVTSPTTLANNELSVKATSVSQSLDSRSGHTAILSADGSSIIVFGGWVGNIATAASPQLIILKVGSGYGGTGNWAWTIPNAIGNGLSTNQGIYGHGAVMLPGNVMMVKGGSIISASTSTSKRATTSQVYFFNATSMSWISSYTNPNNLLAGSSSATSPNSSTAAADYAKKVGLGAGLGIGLVAIIAAIGVYVWYTKRLQKRRDEARERDLRALSRDDEHRYGKNAELDLPTLDMPYWKDELGVQTTLSPLDSRRLDYDSGYHTLLHDVAYLEDTATDSLPRKSINPSIARGLYEPMSVDNVSDNRRNYRTSSHHRSNSKGNSGTIHPIYEADEEADIAETAPDPASDRATSSLGMRMDDPSHELFMGYGPISPLSDHHDTDPFRDPSPQRSNTIIQRPINGLASHPPNQTAISREREREVATWVADWTAADALLHARPLSNCGRLSPSKESSSGRTRSDLSERSTLSSTTMTLSRSDSMARSNSVKAYFTGAGNNWNSYFSGSLRETSSVKPAATSGRCEPVGGTYPSAGRGHAIYNAHPSQSAAVPAKRPESQSLLPSPYMPDGPGSPSKHRARRNMGWLGSIKKVFVGEEWVSASDTSSDRANSPTKHDTQRNSSMLGAPTAYMGAHNAMYDGNDEPQRSVSTSTMLWRRKQGREDWEDSSQSEKYDAFSKTMQTAHKDNDAVLQSRSGPDEDEWDVERAIRERVVQVMFTVPKEKLRVVNHSVDDDASDIGSVAGSVRSKKSINMLSRKKSTLSLTRVVEDAGHHHGTNVQAPESSISHPPALPMANGSSNTSRDLESGSVENGIGERIEGRRIGEVVGRPASPDKRRSRVLDMVDKMEKG